MPKISRPCGPLVSKHWGPSFFFRAIFGCSNIFYTSCIEISQHCQGPFGPLVLTFCGALPNFEGNWPRSPPSTPGFINNFSIKFSTIVRISRVLWFCFYFATLSININVVRNSNTSLLIIHFAFLENWLHWTLYRLHCLEEGKWRVDEHVENKGCMHLMSDKTITRMQFLSKKKKNNESAMLLDSIES